MKFPTFEELLLKAGHIHGIWDRAKDKSYTHYFTSDDDSTWLVDDLEEKIVYCVRSSGDLYVPPGERIGAFHMYAHGWLYCPQDKALPTIETIYHDLLKAERHVFKQLLGVA